MPYIPVVICNIYANCVLDTGAAHNVGYEFIKNKLHLEDYEITKTSAKIKGITGNLLAAVGEVDLFVSFLGKRFMIHFFSLRQDFLWWRSPFVV